jgi:hypothetical protein
MKKSCLAGASCREPTASFAASSNVLQPLRLKRIIRTLFHWLFGSFFLLPISSFGTDIQYQATDLPDSVPGEDLWQYHYVVSGSFAPFTGFNILFDPTQYGALSDASGGGGNWDTLSLDPDPLFPADGIFSASVSSSATQTSAEFDVTFVWLGSGTPAEQGFEVFDDLFNVVETGQTTPSSGPPADTDGDGVPDTTDNCINQPNADQRDTDGDGYGNMCDGDLNNDASTNTLDLNLLKLAYRSAVGDANYNVDADLNGDGVINTLDLNIFKGLYRKPPGPSCCGAF